MSNQLPAVMNNDWELRKEQATLLVKTGFLPYTVNTPEKAIAIMMYGDALGILPIVALNTINIIQGKPTIPPQMMIALAMRGGLLEDMKIDDDGQCCTVTVKRKGVASTVTGTFSIADADKMRTTAKDDKGDKITIPLSKKDNWVQQPKIMRQWRAVAAVFRLAFPDVILGFYTPEEMGATVDVTDDGEVRVIEADVYEPRTQAPMPKSQPGKAVDLEEARSNVDLVRFTNAIGAVLEVITKDKNEQGKIFRDATGYPDRKSAWQHKETAEEMIADIQGYMANAPKSNDVKSAT